MYDRWKDDADNGKDPSQRTRDAIAAMKYYRNKALRFLDHAKLLEARARVARIRAYAPLVEMIDRELERTGDQWRPE